MKNCTFLVILIASSLRFLGGYSIGFWAPKFFTGKFPEYKSEYSFANMLICAVLGMSAAYFGGYIGDKYESRFPMTKALLDCFCSIAAFPFILFSYSLSTKFYVSISLYACSYFFSEMWYGSCVSMLLTLFPAEVSGLAISVFSLSGAFMGGVSSLVLGILGDHYNTKEYP